jgi:hypothetical protein
MDAKQFADNDSGAVAGDDSGTGSGEASLV